MVTVAVALYLVASIYFYAAMKGELGQTLSVVTKLERSLAESQAQLHAAHIETKAVDSQHISAMGKLEKSLAESQAQLQLARAESKAADAKHASAMGALEEPLANDKPEMQVDLAPPPYLHEANSDMQQADIDAMYTGVDQAQALSSQALGEGQAALTPTKNDLAVVLLGAVRSLPVAVASVLRHVVDSEMNPFWLFVLNINYSCPYDRSSLAYIRALDLNKRIIVRNRTDLSTMLAEVACYTRY